MGSLTLTTQTMEMTSYVSLAIEAIPSPRSMQRTNAKLAIRRPRSIRRILRTTMLLTNNFNNRIKLVAFNSLTHLMQLTLIWICLRRLWTDTINSMSEVWEMVVSVLLRWDLKWMKMKFSRIWLNDGYEKEMERNGRQVCTNVGLSYKWWAEILSFISGIK
jgi:hypothetical protein